MSPEKKIIAARLRKARGDRGWGRGKMAVAMKATARRLGIGLPEFESVITCIKLHERGVHLPGADYRTVYAATLGAPLAELFGPVEDVGPSLWRAEGLNGAFTPDDEERLVLATRNPGRIDLVVVDSLAAILAAQRRTEDSVGSAPLLKPVRAQLDTIQDLAIETRGPIRPKVVGVAAQWAQFYGWLQANTGDLSAGKAWLDLALGWAAETGDVNLISEVLSFKGHVAWMARQVGPMIGLSAAALRGDGLYPGQYAISAAQEARGHAMAGDPYEMERKLHQADEQAAAARERQEEAPPWLYYHSPGFFDLQRGLAYRYLAYHDPAYNQRAIDTLTRGLATLPAEMRPSEWAAEFVHHLGRAYLQAGELERAADLARELQDLAQRIESKQVSAWSLALQEDTPR